jgi:hypothetical protein
MPTDNVVRTIHSKTPNSATMLANVKLAMAITARLNRLTFNDADEIRALFSQLVGKEVDESFLLIPPFFTACGNEIRVGRNVFVNQNCTFYDLGGLDIADDVLIWAQRQHHHDQPSPRTLARTRGHNRKAHRDRERRVDRSRRRRHRWRDSRRAFRRGGRFGRHQGRSRE